MLMANKQHEERFNTMLLTRMEQKELTMKQQQLKQEVEKRQQVQLRFMILSGGFIIISALTIFLFRLYRNKRAAYQELVRKSQQWAQVNEERETDFPDDTDFLIMKEIEALMLKEIYKNSALSLEMLAKQLGAKRNYVSGAINRCTKKNFNTFVNEYRIKEAIRHLSKKNIQSFSIDSIAFEVGFNDPRNFFRVFKKMTGLTPTEFVNNIKQ
jgi:YesN/AraC family two-component response regulator